MQVTINDVCHAVAQALEAAFPTIPAVDEEAEQPLDPPRFIVRLQEMSHTHELGGRYRRVFSFVVRYLSLEQTREDMYDKAEQLTTALRRIAIGGGQLPGNEMRFEIADGELHFRVSYSMLVREQAPAEPAMQDLRQEARLYGQ